MLTQESLKKLLSYDPNTGRLTWLVDRAPSALAGSIAGNIHHTGYHDITVCGRQYRAHRVIWLYVYGTWPVGDIDHINQVKNDNRIANLRDVTRTVNARNKPVYANSPLGLHGVLFHKRLGKYQAAIRCGGRQVQLGTFDNLLDAAAARRSAENRLTWTADIEAKGVDLSLARRPHSNCRTGLPGVCTQRTRHPYMARINVDGRRLFLGEFDNIFDAAAARISAENRYWTASSNQF